jgi:hypothetical protein
LKPALWHVLALTGAAYAGLVGAGWVWDDHSIILDNWTLDHPTWGAVWRGDFWCCTGGRGSGYYRPLTTASFLLDRTLFGRDPAGPHLHGLLWHMAAVALVHALLTPRIGGNRALVGATIFSLHPLQSEAVAWVAARNDTMVATLGLLSLLAADRGRPWLCGIAALAAALTKETAFGLPMLVVAWRLAWSDRLPRREVLAMCLGLTVAVAFRSGAFLGAAIGQMASLPLVKRRAITILVTALGWISWPWPLTGTASVLMATPGRAGWTAALVTVVGGGWLLARAPWRNGWLLVLAAATLAPCLPSLAAHGLLGERYFYLAMFGIAAVVASTVPWSKASGALGLGALLAALLALYTRLPDWADNVAFFSAAVERRPDGVAWNQLTDALSQAGRKKEALEAAEAALADPRPDIHACKKAPALALAVYGPERVIARKDAWVEMGCRSQPFFDGAVALALAEAGQWEEARRMVEDEHWDDPKRRDLQVFGALAMRDHDFDALASAAAMWPGARAEFLDGVLALTLARHGDDD